MPTSQLLPQVSDAAQLFDGICFDAAQAIAGDVFILTEQAHLDALYRRIDDSRRCPQPMHHSAVDFSTGRAVVGTWTYAPRGCAATHDLVSITRDEAARTQTLRYRFTVTGDCPYELLRPLWVSVDNSSGYALVLDVQR